MLELRYPLYDGKKIWAGAAVTVENGIITAVSECDPSSCRQGFLMPCLIDAHVHMGTMSHVEAMLRNGVTAVCDVSASEALISSSDKLDIIGSGGMAMGVIVNPRSYVKQAAANGAKYIKVLLFNALSIGKPALCGIVREAHAQGLKVAVHATEITTVNQAIDANADILLHVPMKERLSEETAAKIAEKGIAVAPTLIMMETFAHSGKNGYEPAHYQNAEYAVSLLRDHGVSILAATDANPGSFAPAVGYGDTLHREMELLVKAGMTPLEVLGCATSANADAFELNCGKIAPGSPANMLLINGRPDKDIRDIGRIQNIWVKGEILK